MSVLTAVRRADAKAVSLSKMNGRGDLVGVSLPSTILNAVGVDLTTDDSVRALPDPSQAANFQRGPDADLRLFLTDAAADVAGAWRDLGRNGSIRSVVAMNGSGETVGVSLPRDTADGALSEADAVLVPRASGVVDVHVPSQASGE